MTGPDAPLAIEPDELLRKLVASVRDYAIFVLDPAGQVATWNAGAERLKGYRADEIIGRHFSAFYPPEDVKAGKCELELVVAAREGRFEDEGWRVRNDGTRFWANVVITAMRDERGLLGFAKVTRDLTERKQAETERLASEERYRFLVDSVKDYAIFILDPDGRVATWNAGAERIKGYRAGEIIGSHFSRFYPEDDVRLGKCELELRIAERDGRFEDEGWRIRKDGSRFWANVVISPIHNPGGTLVGFSKVTRDLTQRRQTEEARTALLAAESTNKAKDEFLAMLGHELRNPLAPIATAVELARANPESVGRAIDIVERQSRQLMRLVDDLLDVSRIGQGKVTLVQERIDLCEVLRQSIETAQPLVGSKQHALVAQLPDEPVLVEGDRGRLIQVFANLLTNAAKYTDAGGEIRISCVRTVDAIAVEIRDNGVGISPSLLPRVFDVFVQEAEDAHRSGGGLGLGLKLVKSLVELHGGSVTADSDGRGMGSRFTVRLPCVRTTPASVELPLAGGRRVLVVDDNEDALILMAELLRDAGHDVRTASDGPSALSVFESFSPEVALLDLGLPGMDGNELATRIRVGLGRKIKLIALTGYAAGESATCFDRHALKPLAPRTLLQLVAST